MKSKELFKMNSENLQGLLHMRKRSFAIQPKKGKGSFKRQQKHKDRYI